MTFDFVVVAIADPCAACLLDVSPQRIGLPG